MGNVRGGHSRSATRRVRVQGGYQRPKADTQAAIPYEFVERVLPTLARTPHASIARTCPDGGIARSDGAKPLGRSHSHAREGGKAHDIERACSSVCVMELICDL